MSLSSTSNEESKLMTDSSIRELSAEGEDAMLKEFINVWVRELVKVLTKFKFVSSLTLI